jgi:hypothetical protein
LTAQGSPRSIFKRAVEHGNLLSAGTVRWLRRLLEEDENLSIEEAALAASALAALGGRGHEQAVSTLSALADTATRQVRRPQARR